MFGHFGWGELLLILAIALLIFGAEKLPQIGRSLGSSFHEFKNAVNPGSSAPLQASSPMVRPARASRPRRRPARTSVKRRTLPKGK